MSINILELRRLPVYLQLPVKMSLCFIKKVQVNQDVMKLKGTHQHLAYADDVTILGGSIHTLKENAEALVAATREIGLVVGARDENA